MARAQIFGNVEGKRALEFRAVATGVSAAQPLLQYAFHSGAAPACQTSRGTVRFRLCRLFANSNRYQFHDHFHRALGGAFAGVPLRAAEVVQQEPAIEQQHQKQCAAGWGWLSGGRSATKKFVSLLTLQSRRRWFSRQQQFQFAKMFPKITPRARTYPVYTRVRVRWCGSVCVCVVCVVKQYHV